MSIGKTYNYLFCLVVLTFVGMVGIYIAGYLAYQKYQEIQANGTVSTAGNIFGLLGTLFGKKQ